MNTALRDLEVKAQIFGIIGPANAGKTSFLKSLNRMDDFTRHAGDGGPLRRRDAPLAQRLRTGSASAWSSRCSRAAAQVYDSIALAPRLAGTRSELDVVVSAA